AVEGIHVVRFVFQAEDGIRDFRVTGVQTCALPILQAPLAHSQSVATAAPWSAQHRARVHSRRGLKALVEIQSLTEEESACSRLRSEERRVGRESRLRGEVGEKERYTDAHRSAGLLQ